MPQSLSVHPFISQNVLVLSATTPVRTAARAMAEQRVGSVVIINNHGELAGIVTDRDLSNEVIGYERPLDTPIEDIMSTHIQCVDVDASLDDAIALMEEFGIRRIPVVRRLSTGGGERCEGMISLDDLIVSQAVPGERLASIVRSQVMRRARRAQRAEQRSESRKEQTLKRFYDVMSRELGVEEDKVGQVVDHILRDLVQRLPYTSAAHLIAQLPSRLQDDLLDLPSGPDRTITAESLVHDLTSNFDLDVERSVQMISSFWRGLESFTKHSEPHSVLGQLPEDLRNLFSGKDVDPAQFRSQQ